MLRTDVDNIDNIAYVCLKITIIVTYPQKSFITLDPWQKGNKLR